MPPLLFEGTVWPGMGPPGRDPLQPQRPHLHTLADHFFQSYVLDFGEEPKTPTYTVSGRPREEDETLRGDVPCTRPKSLPAPDPLAQDSQSTLFPANQNISSQISTPVYLGSGIETGSHHRWAMERGTVGKSLKKSSLLTSSASNTGQHHQM
ncbi:dexamethasone-induced protein isoform X2 [Physeter macrocephalus]|uniref:Dexamethasone-induced protein isoform X2 n=1 Tax=Physeter macrocephalus TaxID=9755 RepID=A0A9W2WJ93_PHYMC|nr:dexamethasone-induced protein isoform X2 [Physeter catodon]